MVLREEDQLPKVKRRKAEKSEGQTKSEAKGSTVRAAASKTAVARTANQQIKPLTKVGESSNKSKSSGGMALCVVTVVQTYLSLLFYTAIC